MQWKWAQVKGLAIRQPDYFDLAQAETLRLKQPVALRVNCLGVAGRRSEKEKKRPFPIFNQHSPDVDETARLRLNITTLPGTRAGMLSAKERTRIFASATPARQPSSLLYFSIAYHKGDIWDIG